MVQHKAKINKKKKEAQKEKIVMGFIYLILAFAIIVLFFTAKSLFLPQQIDIQQAQQSSTQVSAMSRMSFTSYDKELARKLMDKNNDGKCDSCGMDVDVCIATGQLECTMTGNDGIGLLDSQHIHADWKIYFIGEPLDFLEYAHMDRMRANLPVSSFIHVDSGAPTPEKTGDVLHMHATGVPIWIFFDSIGLEMPKSARVYVNGKLNSDGLNYVFSDFDKILITDEQGDLNQQLNSITNFAENH